jgi:hypothetical protein
MTEVVDVEAIRKAAEIGAAAGVKAASAGATTGLSQTEAAAAYRSSGAETIADIGQSEAYMLNMKHRVATELATNHRRERNAEDFDQAMRALTLDARQQSVMLMARLNALSIDHDNRLRAFKEREIALGVRTSGLEVDRWWNPDEVAALVAKTPVFLDTVAGAVAAAVAAAVSKPAETKAEA